MTRKQIQRAKQQVRIEAAYVDGSLTPDDVAYRKTIRNKIKAGKLPRFHFVKGTDPKKTNRSTGLPQTKIKRFRQDPATKEFEPVYGGLAFIQVSTMDVLCKKIPQ